MGPWLLLLCCACTLKTSLSSVLTQTPGTVRVSVGEPFTLQCIHEMQVQYCYSTTTWHKVNKRTGQLAEIRPELDMQQTNTKVCTLTISKATLQDSGMYHCTGLYNKIVLVGNGTRVIVTDPDPPSPSIIMYSPLDVFGPTVPLQCLVIGAVPSQVQVVWIIDHSERSGWTESSWIENSDSALEHTRAHITLSEEEWTEAAQIECLAMFDGINVSRTLVPGGNNAGMCSWLLYLGFGAVFLTIAVTITVAVCLRREKRKDAAPKGYCGRNTHSKQPKHGKRDTLRPATERPPRTEVEYSCLNPDSLNKHLNAVQTELQ
ncbi:uncharacterized protein LOC118805002 [Colossoma macropomum]|uniref:uncharacterized protein LOC118805002 n=1 Tax=Colossoma macropomum TaxID=42526 RepID=UPI001864B50A|nr:uncharacterized protein LOC118805002 [Colossoma macropomum]XP_036421493.1 uncharacterized protein LOC118805002 [Colossoma macropomum]XP_036421494.1 uncharacterized protein LOC118805002 [Colossoma macropomum]